MRNSSDLIEVKAEEMHKLYEKISQQDFDILSNIGDLDISNLKLLDKHKEINKKLDQIIAHV